MDIVNDFNMINKPLRYARSVVDYIVGDKNLFFTSGWLVYAEVSDVVETKMFSDFKVYRIFNIEFLEFRGLEYTTDELYKIQLHEEKMQRRYDRLEDEFRKQLQIKIDGKN